jgi:hypothetical protein
MAPSFLLIVVPVYDEQDNLADLHEEIRKVMESGALGSERAAGSKGALPSESAFRYEVIYVDDGSRDDSWNRLVALHQRHPGEVRLIRLRRNFGQTAVSVSEGVPSDLILPPGTYWLAWQVDTIEDVPSYTKGSGGDGFAFPSAYGLFPGIASDALSTFDGWSMCMSSHPITQAGREWKSYR